MLQRHALVTALTASENVELALRARGLGGRDARERAGDALTRVGLGEALDRPAGRLSGGQQQRVAVARALASGPEIVLADEPTSELDELIRELVVRQLRRQAERGAGVLVATHDPAVAAADRRVGLVHGRPA